MIVSAANLHIDEGRIDIAEGTRLVLLQNEIPEAVKPRRIEIRSEAPGKLIDSEAKAA